jgi:glutamyl-tRNA synthetase
MRDLIYPHVIRNASEYGKANSKAVLAKVLGERPDMRRRASEVMAEVEAVVAEVNALSKDEISEKAKEYSFEKRVKKEKGLTELPSAVDGEVRLRFAPNPSGPLHLGHARAAVLNDEYAKRYNGKLILRFEDTDPKRVDSDAYELIRQDLEWLGVTWHEEVLQSDRLDIYYKWARELISKKLVYVCLCRQDAFKTLRESGNACSCRNVMDSPEDFEKMFSEYSEGEAVLRLKTTLAHKNVSIRDFPIMRIVETEHPRVGDKKVYPLMNLSVPVDDHEQGLTHILRGKDHILNTYKQAYIQEYLGWEKPHYVHYGLLNIQDVMLSTSEMSKRIKAGDYSGWNDPRLGTLSALERRGIKSKAVRRVMLDIGVKQTDITFSWKNLYAHNKEIIDPEADRYSFVDSSFIKDKSGKDKLTPFILKVTGCPEITAKKRLHPTVDRGFRTVKLESESQDFLIGSDDFSKLKNGEVVRLMEAYNVKVLSKNTCKNIVETAFQSPSLNEARNKKASLINWVKAQDNILIKVFSPEISDSQLGFADKAIENTSDGEIVQFERYGFVRLEREQPGKITAIFTHK